MREEELLRQEGLIQIDMIREAKNRIKFEDQLVRQVFTRGEESKISKSRPPTGPNINIENYSLRENIDQGSQERKKLKNHQVRNKRVNDPTGSPDKPRLFPSSIHQHHQRPLNNHQYYDSFAGEQLQPEEGHPQPISPSKVPKPSEAGYLYTPPHQQQSFSAEQIPQFHEAHPISQLQTEIRDQQSQQPQFMATVSYDRRTTTTEHTESEVVVNANCDLNFDLRQAIETQPQATHQVEDSLGINDKEPESTLPASTKQTSDIILGKKILENAGSSTGEWQSAEFPNELGTNSECMPLQTVQSTDKRVAELFENKNQRSSNEKGLLGSTE